MWKFNHQFGYKTCKRPIACHQSDIRRWLTSDKIKECRTNQHPAGSISNHPYPVQSTSSESYALDIELLSSTTSLTGAQKQPYVHFIPETSLGDNQEDATRRDVISNSDYDDRQLERHPPLTANGQRELSSDACQSPIIGHGDMHEYDPAVLPPARLEIDKRERRYSDDGHDVGILQRIVVQSTRLPMFPSDAYEKHYVCSEQGDTGDDGLPPCVEQPQHVEIAEEDQSQSIGLNESADLFPDESHQSPSTTGNGKQSSTVSCSLPSVQYISSASLLLSSATTGRPKEVRSNREIASLPCMTNGDTGYPETTVARRTRNTYLKEMYENLTTGNGKSNNESNLKKKSKPHVVNTLPASAVNRKMGNGIFATAYPSSATRIKCSKNSDYNIKCKDTGSDGQRHNCPPAKTLSSNRQAKQIIQPTTEIAARCEDSTRKCKKALKDMNKLLRSTD